MNNDTAIQYVYVTNTMCKLAVAPAWNGAADLQKAIELGQNEAKAGRG